MNAVHSRSILRPASAPVAAAALAACVVLAAPGRAEAQNNNVVQGTIPAFYQHQGANDTGGQPVSPTPSAAKTPAGGNVWQPDQGWCQYVSYLDALYPWETLTVASVHPYDNTKVWLFGAPGAANPGVGTALTSAATWLDAADNTAIPALVGAGSLNNYLNTQGVGVAKLGLAGLLDTQYQTLANGQVQVNTIAGWKNITPNTFQLYQQLTGTGANLPAALQPFAAITTDIRIGYVGVGNPNPPLPPVFLPSGLLNPAWKPVVDGQAATGFWWSFHQVAGAGVVGPVANGGANGGTIQYSDPDAIPANAGNRNGGFTQAAVTANAYNLAQKAGAPPLPTNVNPVTGAAYGAGNLYSTMQVDAMGQVIGGNGPYASGLKGAAAPQTRITNIEAISLPAAQLVNLVAGPLFDTAKFLFSGNFGGDISKLEIFADSPLYAANLGLSETDPNWTISQVMTDPFGNSWAGTNGGILLSEGAGGSDLMENGPDYTFTEDTTGPITGWTVFAYDQADGYWLVQTYGVGDAIGGGAQVVPEPSTWLLMAAGLLGLVFHARRRSPRRGAGRGDGEGRGDADVVTGGDAPAPISPRRVPSPLRDGAGSPRGSRSWIAPVVAACVAVLTPARAQGGPGLVPPPLLPFDYVNQARTLDIVFAANGQFASPDVAAVDPNPYPVGNAEPDPTPGDATFTFGDAVRRAAAAWNAAATGWTLDVLGAGAMPAPGVPVITVQLDSFGPAGAPPHVGATTDILALFQPGPANGANQISTATISFNVRYGIQGFWGIDNNTNKSDMEFDPILFALHELGHAIRLDHEPLANSPDNGSITANSSANDSIMEPLMDAGVHQLNPIVAYNRYPNAVDIAAARASAAVPEPGSLVPGGAGALAMIAVVRHRSRRGGPAGRGAARP